MAEKDESYSDFNPEHHSSMKEATPAKDNKDTDMSYSDFNPPHHSSMKEATPEKMNKDADITFSDFNPPHHSSMNDPVDITLGRHAESPITSPPDTKKIIQETEDLLDRCLKKVLDQEKVLISMAYRIYNMSNDVHQYRELVDQFDRFVTSYDPVFQEYSNASQALTLYGEVALQLSSQPKTEEEPGDLSRDAVLEISRNILDTGNAGTLTLNGQNSMVTNVIYQIPDSLWAISEFVKKDPQRMMLLDESLGIVKRLADGIIKIKTHLHYLIIGDNYQTVSDFSTLTF